MASPSPSSSPSPPPPPLSLPPPQLPYENETQSPNPTAPANNTTTITTAKKPQPLPWTHQETINLIQAYQEKWYSLKRGQLKASQWEEISVTVAARCGYDEPSKTATQCRHKIEKLRKRYRAEKGKPRPDYWQYYDLMDRMERGPLPITAARPVSMVQYQQSNQPNSSSSDSDVDYNLNFDNKKNKSKSINHIVKGENSRVFRVSRTPVVRKREEFFDDGDGDGDDDEDDEEEEEGREGSEMVAQLAVEIRAFAERFVKMENKKIEMMRDMERYRMEMENKRMEMILESQQKLVDTIHKAFSSSHKKVKLAQ